MKRFLSAVLCFLLLLSILPLSAIAEGESVPPPAPVLVAAIAIQPPDGADATLTIGESMALLATVTPAEAANPALLWTSGNDACATVGINGLVTAIAEGTATITATATDGGGCFGTLDILVEAPVIVQETVPETPVDTPVTPPETPVSDTPVTPPETPVAPVAEAAPPATVPATAVTVSAPDNATTVALDATLALSATVSPEDATDQTVTWSVTGGTGAASIDPVTGLLTPLTAGSVTVTATANGGNGVSHDYPLEILAAAPAAIPVTAIEVTAADNATTVAIGGTLALLATVAPEDAADKTVAWSVGNGAGTATIDPVTGLLTGGTAGDVTVTATANDGSLVTGTLTITVSAFTGDGTAEAPYGIGTLEELTLLSQLVNGGNAAFSGAHYRQTAPISLSGASWTPIGTSASPFTGTFDGQGKGISGLTGGGDGSGYFGLFSETHNATLTGIVMEETALTLGGSYAGAGAIVGRMVGGSLTKSYASGTVDTTFTGGATGGLVGVLAGGAVTDCMNAAKVTAVQNAGGIAGQADAASTIATSYGSGLTRTTDITSPFGMIVAQPAEGTTVQSCYGVDGTDPLARGLAWADGGKAESFSGFDFTDVWTMGTGAYYTMPVLKDSPFAGDESWVREDVEYPTGYRPSGIEVPTLTSKRRMRSTFASAYLPDTTTLPSIRNQGGYGTCWAHSVIFAAEMDRIKDTAETKAVDYSELQLAWFHWMGPKKPDGTYNDLLDNFGGDRNHTTIPFNVGGNDHETGLSLASWMGVAREDDSVTSYSSIGYTTSMPYEYAFSKDVAHLKSMRMVSWSQPDVNAIIKQAVLDHGTVTISMCQNDTLYQTYNQYYFMSKGSYDKYINGVGGDIDFRDNHAVTIVGWDDTLSKSHFEDTNNGEKPVNDGAWLVRNSYGSWWNGMGGYFYMSYDTKLNARSNDYISIWDFTDATDYERCYQYDGAAYPGGGTYYNEISLANIFTADNEGAAECIRAASFWLYSAGVNYTIKVYTGLTNPNDPTSGTLVPEATATGTTGYIGYYTVDLPTSVLIPDGTQFSIVLTLEKNGTHIYYAYDARDSYGYNYAFSSPGESFWYDSYRGAWIDPNADGQVAINYRIKAFGTTLSTPVTSIAVNSDPASVEVDKTLQMRATIEPTNATIQTVTWSVAPATAATTPGSAAIDENGLLTGVTVGKVVVKATAKDGSGISGTKEITILPKKVTSITVTAPTYVEVGEAVTCSANVLPTDAGDKTVEWSVAPAATDPGSATSAPAPSSTGEPMISLTGDTEGKVVVTATAKDGSGILGEATVTVVAAGALHTVTVDTASIGFTPASELYIDGAKYSGGDLNKAGATLSANVLNTTATNAVVYSYNSSTATDPHKVYPTKMSVWELTYNTDPSTSAVGDYIATRLTDFDDLLQYAGSSIRIVGEKGIRLISGVPIATRNRLINSNINGYYLEEYGTVLAWANTIDTEHPLTLRAGVMSGVAYKRGVKDPIFRQTGTAVQYTNVLTKLTLDKCRDDLLMRPYIKLKHATTGESLTLYGGIVSRSIGYIAWQNKSAFPAGSAAYNYIWDIINYVYNGNYPS